MKENNRLDKNDPDSLEFDRILNNIRDGEITENDCEIIRNKCSRNRMGIKKIQEQGFEEDGVTHLFSTNEQADKLNDLQLLNLQQGVKQRKIARITAENSPGARLFANSNARKLINDLFLCVDSKVTLFHNMKQDWNLVNGSIGYVKEIVYAEGEKAPSLPKYILVDFGEFILGRIF